MRTLNLGILAHVDAGKTTLTERLLHAVGVIDEIGSVDDGTTQTDSLALERQRGITIKSAVVSFVVDDLTVNLIDTPGHPDFIAEVDRALNVLDGVVLVISAVEGVQPQTRILMRALQRLRVPTLMFVNKIDRTGAAGDVDGSVRGSVFKIERGAAGEKVAYVRMFSGTIQTRDRVEFGRGKAQTVTMISVFERGGSVHRASVGAGQIAELWGLNDVQIGDRIGRAGSDGTSHRFAPPTMESVVVAVNPDDRARLRVALAQLAEQDPLINVRQDDALNEISVSLYGEVQKEVIGATLA